MVNKRWRSDSPWKIYRWIRKCCQFLPITQNFPSIGCFSSKKNVFFEDVISGWAVTFKNSFFSEICVFSSQLYDEIRMVLIKWILEVKKSKKLKKTTKNPYCCTKTYGGLAEKYFFGSYNPGIRFSGKFYYKKTLFERHSTVLHRGIFSILQQKARRT